MKSLQGLFLLLVFIHFFCKPSNKKFVKFQDVVLKHGHLTNFLASFSIKSKI